MKRKFLAKILVTSLVITAAPGIGINSGAEELSKMSQKTGEGYLSSTTSNRGAGDSGTSDITSGLIGYYDFEDSLANKITGGGAAKLHGGAGDTWNTAAVGEENYENSSTQELGKAYDFLGDKDNVRGEGLELDVTMPEEFTISYLVKPRTLTFATSTVFSPVSLEEGLNIADFGFLPVGEDNVFPTVRIWGSNSNTLLANSGNVIDGAENKWYYITLTGNKEGDLALYVDGILKDSKKDSEVVSHLTGMPIFLGINFWDVSFNGLMDEVRIYNRVLSAEDVAGLYSTITNTPVVPTETPDTEQTPAVPTETPGTNTTAPTDTSKPVAPSGDWPDVTELDCPEWWKGHTKGLKVDENGVTFKFKNTTYPTVSDVWTTPSYVVYTGDTDIVNGAGYTEFGVKRTDNWGWDGSGKTGTMAWEEGVTMPSAWMEANHAGADYEVSAIRKVNTVFIKVNAAGYITYAAIPVAEGKPAYLALTGDHCKLENIAQSAYTSFEIPATLADVSPTKPKPLAPYPIILPTSEPLPTPDANEAESETLAGTAWWTGSQKGKDYVLNGDGTLELYVNYLKAAGTEPGAFSVELLSDGNKYITTGSDINIWTAEGALNQGETLSGATLGGVITEEHKYKVSVTRSGKDFTIVYFDMADNKEHCKLIAKNTNLGNSVNVHVMAQVGTFRVSQGSISSQPMASTEPTAAPATSAEPTATPGASAAPTKEPGASPAPGNTSTPADPGTTNTPSEPGNTATPEDPSNTDKPSGPEPEETEKPEKKTMKLSGIKAKTGTKKVTGTVSVKKAVVKVKVGNKDYKKAKVNGKKFTFTASSKLKKGTKITIKVTKTGYKAVTKTTKVK